MRKLLPLIAGGLLAAGPALAANPQGEEQLERALAGRVAGEPVRCINLHGSSSSTIIDDTAILYRVGGTIYVNRPRAGAESLDRSDTMVNRLWGSQLCSIDTVRMVDPTTGFFRGIVFLGEFVPYRRVSSARN
ncbi:hypothetical protein [Sphingosinicella sp.]|uniref:hypothetical protein n=1 Tax=Sphingosinicella sp. TaxID=1917971 RepID=UPI004037DDED